MYYFLGLEFKKYDEEYEKSYYFFLQSKSEIYKMRKELYNNIKYTN